MPYINLIQEHIEEVRKSERTARAFFMGFAGTAVLALGTVGFLFVLTEAANGEASSLQAQAQRIQPIIGDIEAAKSEYMKLNPRLQTLNDARDITSKWSRVLEHLTTNTPQEVWLTSIKAQQPDPKAPIQIAFNGMSTRQELIGEFMLRLDKCEDLEAINLKFSQEKPVEQTSRLEFEVDANVAGTVEEKAGPKEETK